MKTLIVAAISALTAIMANKGIAVFNDGLRPVLPEFYEGRMSRKELAATSFAMGFGLVVGFGIPFSLTSNIILAHSILLGTDIIGVFCPEGRKGEILSGVIGGLYGIGIVKGLEAIVNLFASLPVNFLEELGAVGDPVIVSFAVFPALATAFQYGAKSGLLNLGLSLLARQLTILINPLEIGNVTINLNQEGMALIVGMIILIIYAVKEKSEDEAIDLKSVFGERVDNIKKNMPILLLTGALVAVAASMDIMAGEPVSLNLASEGQHMDAAFAALARGIGHIPLKVSTAIVTGAYSPVGMFIFAVGLFIKKPIIAFFAGAIVMALEVLFIEKLGNLLDKYPGIRNAGDNIRTAMSKVLEVALLVGGMNAANAIAPGLGFFTVAGLYIINEIAGTPVTRMAVGPIAAIFVGILVNLLSLVGMFTV